MRYGNVVNRYIILPRLRYETNIYTFFMSLDSYDGVGCGDTFFEHY